MRFLALLVLGASIGVTGLVGRTAFSWHQAHVHEQAAKERHNLQRRHQQCLDRWPLGGERLELCIAGYDTHGGQL